MKSQNVLLLNVLLVLGLAGTANATHFVDFSPTADCQGWSVEGSLGFGSIDQVVTLDYSVVLSQNGTEVEAFDGEFDIETAGGGSIVPFSVAGAWQEDLCGDYTVDGIFHVTAANNEDTRTFSISFDDCDCPGEDCYLTPGFWKNHPDAWPVAELTMGDIAYGQDELIEILCTPVRGDATVILAHHLIAAKLNVLAGADNTIQDAIDAGDEFLADYGYGTNPDGEARELALEIKDDLEAYNEQGCDDEDDEEDEDDDEDKALDDAVQSSWSTVKQTYR